MKKILFGLVTVLLVTVMMSASLPAFATTEPDYYTPAKEGELLHEINFLGDLYWKPVNIRGDFGFTPLSATSAEIVGNINSSQNWYGAELEGFPLDYAGYTITMSITRNEKACFGLYVDGTYGCYGYAEQLHLMNVGSPLAGDAAHPYVKLYTIGDFPGVDAEGKALSDGSTQEYAMEVDGFTYNLRFYVKDKAGQWQLIDESRDGEILTFATYNLGIYFYSYYTQKAIISDIRIYKGYTISNTPLQTETAPVVTTTEKAPETNPPVTTPKSTTANTTAPIADTKGPDATTTAKAKDDKKSGCGSALAGSAVMLSGFMTAAFCLKKKKK